MIVNIASAVAVMDEDAARRPFDRCHGATEPQPIAKCGSQFLDVALAAAFYGAPDRTIILQQPMILEEGDEVLGGEVQHLAGRRRPDRGAHRGEIIGQQPWCKIAKPEILAERKPGEPAGDVVFDALAV